MKPSLPDVILFCSFDLILKIENLGGGRESSVRMSPMQRREEELANTTGTTMLIQRLEIKNYKQLFWDDDADPAPGNYKKRVKIFISPVSRYISSVKVLSQTERRT